MLWWWLQASALAGWLSFGVVENPAPGEQPSIVIQSQRDIGHIQVVVESAGQAYKFTRDNAPAGKLTFAWDRTEATTAVVKVLCDFADGSEEEYEFSVQWSYGGGLSVNLENAKADLKNRTVTVEVTAPVQRAEIIAYGEHKTVLETSEVPLNAGPGQVEIPWVGRPSEVVLLDIKLFGDRAWVSFTYSPWFLNIPHEDVHFPSDGDAIAADQEPKLQETLGKLQEVLSKYGDVVPVKLYIAGCTDTVGSDAHNLDLSRRRARAIAAWLRNHGYRQPIYYHGFGEGLLAEKTGDNVDNASNRRAIYLVGVNPPPPGSGIPSVPWTPL